MTEEKEDYDAELPKEEEKEEDTRSDTDKYRDQYDKESIQEYKISSNEVWEDDFEW